MHRHLIAVSTGWEESGEKAIDSDGFQAFLLIIAHWKAGKSHETTAWKHVMLNMSNHRY